MNTLRYLKLNAKREENGESLKNDFLLKLSSIILSIVTCKYLQDYTETDSIELVRLIDQLVDE